MTKPTPKPDNIELMTRKQFSRIAEIDVSRINKISLTEACNFPQPVCKFAHNEIAYNKAELLAWLQKNDMKKMCQLAAAKYTCRTERTRISRQLPKREPMQKLDNSMVLNFLTRKLSST